MSTPRFFVEHLQVGAVSLNDDEARHARGSRRLDTAERVVLFDGRGNEGEGSIRGVAGKRHSVEVVVEVVRHRLRPSLELTLAIAVPKGPRQDWMVEKCTELGVRAIWPLVTERSISGASGHRLTKWRQIAIEAAKQSGQAWLPEFLQPVELERLWEEATQFDRVYITSGIADSGFAPPVDCKHLLMLVGPEGGWTPHELETARGRGALPITLGPNVLRIETAAIALAAIIHASLHSK